MIGTVRRRARLTGEDVEAVADVVDRFFSIRVMDSGNQPSSSVFQGALDNVDALGIPTFNAGASCGKPSIEVNGYLVESTPKDYEERSIPVPAFVLELLRVAVVDRPATDHVFVGLRGGGVLRNRVFRRGFLTAAADEIGVPGLTPHELRRTCASLAVLAGANVKALQRMPGHASATETLDTYADLFDSDVDSVAVALDDRVEALSEVKNVVRRPNLPNRAGTRTGLDWDFLGVPPGRFELPPLPPEGEPGPGGIGA